MPQRTSPSAKARDWRALDAAHKRRGQLITVLLDPHGAAFTPPERVAGRRGRPQLYSDALIEAAFTVKVLLGLSLRALEGFLAGMRDLVGGEFRVPDYSTLSLRERTLQVDLGARCAPGKRHVLMVDSTGLKVFGEGEWKVRLHGAERRRTWKKLHLLVDRESGHVTALALTDKNTHDGEVLPALLPADLAGDFVLGDGAYHTRPAHRAVFGRGGTLLSPPPQGARAWKPHHRVADEPALRFRNAQLTPWRRLGKTEWGKHSGYSRRSFVESTMHRLKALTGARLSARTADRQLAEVRLRARVLNELTVSTWQAPAA